MQDFEPSRSRRLANDDLGDVVGLAKLITSSAMLRPPPGTVIASPPNASASRSVSATRSRSSSLHCRLRRVSTHNAVNGARKRSARRLA